MPLITQPESGLPHAQRPRLIVTRPAEEATLWTRHLGDAGWPAVALPLIDVGSPREAAALRGLAHWRANWREMQALMFVSGAAVKHFWADAEAPVRPDGTRIWAPGPGTARALLAQGVPADHLDTPAADAPQFDSEALWDVVASQVRTGHRLLIVRGASADGDIPTKPGQQPGQGRDWLIRQCEAQGAHVQACVAYERHVPVWGVVELALARSAAVDGSVWLLSSSQALANLQMLLPDIRWQRAVALVTHPRIAQTARAAGFGRVLEARPAFADVLRALESEWKSP